MTLFHQHDIFKHLLVYCSKVSPQPEKINVESKCWAAGQMCCIIHHLCFQSLLLVCLFCNANADIIYLYCCSSMYVPRESNPWPWRSECQLSWMPMTWICFQKGGLFYLIQLFSNLKAKNYTHFCELSGMPTVCVCPSHTPPSNDVMSYFRRCLWLSDQTSRAHWRHVSYKSSLDVFMQTPHRHRFTGSH